MHIRRVSEILLAALLATFSIQAQPKPKTHLFKDPGIPGITIIGASDPAFKLQPGTEKLDQEHGFVIHNNSKHVVVGLAIQTAAADGRRYSVSINGLDDTFAGLQPGAMAFAGPGYIRAGDSTMSFPSQAEDIRGAGAEWSSLLWVLFDDGSFYGDPGEGKKLADRIEHGAEFLKAASQAKDVDAFLNESHKCGTDIDCARASGIRPEIWNVRNGITNSINAYRSVNQSQAENLLDFYKRLYGSHVRVKSVTSIREELLPESPGDGWAISSLKGSCSNDSPAYIFGQTKNCVYPLDAAVAGPNVASLDAPSANGHWLYYQGQCLKFIPNQISPVKIIKHRATYGRLDPSSPDNRYLPRNKTYDSLFSNYGAYQNFGPDAVTSTVVVGLKEPMAVDSNTDGGNTACYVAWLDVHSNNIEHVDALTPVNTTLTYQPYGYTLDNDTHVETCGGLITDSLAYPLQGPRAYSFGTIYETYSTVACVHDLPRADNGGGGQTCSTRTDYCCCLAALGGDFVTCGQLCIDCNVPLFGCDTAAEAGDYVTLTENESLPISTISSHSTSTSADPTRFGVFRTGNSFLLNNIDGSYQAGATTSISTFLPPGGVTSDDVAVSGDWAGLGTTCLGYYRQSTGMWYLDANCDGIWSGTSGGDYQYQFGGSPSGGTPHTASWIPPDVPVVGDWEGLGKSCVGVFRYGYLWVLDANCNGQWDGALQNGGQDAQFAFGGFVGDIPVVGHWHGKVGNNPVIDQVGVVSCYTYPGSNGCTGPNYFWILDSAYATDYLQSNHQPGLGGTNCAPYDFHCLTPSPFAFGGVAFSKSGYGPYTPPSPLYDQYVVGDWDGSGVSRAGVYRVGTWLLDTGNHIPSGFFQFGGYVTYIVGGFLDDKAMVGKW